MAANKLTFKDAELVRDSITESQQKEIASLYKSWADEIGERAAYYEKKSNISSELSAMQMKDLQKQLNASSKQVSQEVYKSVKSNMYIVSDSVVKSNSAWLSSLGFDKKGLDIAYSSVPDSVVRSIVTGQVYDSGWSLSQRIWGNNNEQLKGIYEVVAKGVAQNKPIYDIAKNLEAYVRPGAKLPWNLTTSDGVKIFKKQVDYNAQRLARTLVQHSYQQSVVAVTKKNPFVLDFIWHANGSRVCELCQDRDGAHFSKDNLPLDHPNGMCTIEPNIADNIIDQLADWVNSPDGTYPEIDEFAKNFGYQGSVATFTDLQNKYLSPYGFSPNNMPKTFDDWSYKLSYEHKTEILKQMGTDWGDPHPYQQMQKFYNQNLAKVQSQPKTTVVVSKKEKVPEFTAWQKKYLSPYGYSTGNMPKNYDEWYYACTYKDYESLCKEAAKHGMTPVQFYDSKVGKLKYKYKEVSAISSSADDAAKAIVNASQSTTADEQLWLDKIKNQTESEMLAKESAQMAKMSADEIAGIRTYTGSSYDEINSYYRNLGRGMSESDAINKAYISESQLAAGKNAKAGLSKAALDEDLVLRRGTDVGDLAGLMPGDFRDNKQLLRGMTADEMNTMLAGTIGEMHGFTSTSSIWDRGFSGDVEVIFYAPKGTEASSIMSISRFGTGEGETLLNAGTKVRVVKIEESDGHKSSNIRVFMEILV
ncbi:MAG: hypothetical protein J6R68_04140 [Clostridia bacterium]|nr:hypothetical protein [Clostridia bacterium]MBO7289555.1 hypothetical protein [Clostridia bacterium]